MTTELFTSDYRDQPYWWDTGPRPNLTRAELPERTDVVVVGSGYTGLSAALVMARGGRDVTVIDAETMGYGCSSRNGGQLSPSIKPGFDELSGRFDRELAFAIRREGLNALAHTLAFIEGEGIDCDLQRVGRFHAAHNAKQYEKLARAAQRQVKGIEIEAHMVPRAEQDSELASDSYHGGCVFPSHCALDPARYHLGILERARDAGATLVDHCRVTAIEPDGQAFDLHTTIGRIRARDVVIATNGYTLAVTPFLRRRVIPIGSYIIATEPIDPALVARLIPNNRVLSDTRRVVFYFRACPERRRILFGGRVAVSETDPTICAPRLHAALCRIWPELRETRISHAWAGFVAYTFDTLPHIGKTDGLYYAMGYCGSGVSLASYFGTRIGQQVLGLKEGRTALDGLQFPTRPLYTGTPWFLEPAIVWHRTLDSLPI